MGSSTRRTLVAASAIAGLGACGFRPQGSAGSDGHGPADSGSGGSEGTPKDAAIDAPPDGPAPIALAQVCARVSMPPAATISCTTAGAQTVGNTNIVFVDWGGAAGLTSLSDTAGNTYVPTGLVGSGIFTSVLLYAPITKGGTNTVTATLTANGTNLKVRVLEYAGLAAANPYTGGVAGSGTGASMTAGPVVTSSAPALLLAAARPEHSGGAVAPFVARDTSDGDLVEEDIVPALGSYAASATQAPAGSWVMLLAAFRGR